MRLLALATLSATALLAGTSASASASTASINGTTLTVNASPGEVNDFYVTRDTNNNGDPTGPYMIYDDGYDLSFADIRIQHGAGCSNARDDESTPIVTCPIANVTA